jgi:hypothetical protein
MGLLFRVPIAVLCAVFALVSVPADAQIYDVRDLNVDQIRSLDRQHTVVVL